VLPILEQPVEQLKHRTITNPSTSPRTQSGYADTGWTSGLRLVMRGSGSGSENKIANREPFWEPDHAANLVQPRTCTENTSAVLSVKADLPDQSERLVEAYGSEGWGFESLRVRNVFSLVRDIPLTDGGLTIRAQGQLTATLTATRFNSAKRRLDPWRPRLRVARSA
jgi:hypothetical protein